MTTWMSNGWVWASAPDWDGPIGPDNAAYDGKWLVFVQPPYVSQMWDSIVTATEAGKLGGLSKIIMEPGRAAPAYVICIYTTDYRDQAEVTRVLTVLRGLGIKARLFYKEDAVTRAGLYSDTGSTSLYEAPAGSIQIKQRRSPRIPDEAS